MESPNKGHFGTVFLSFVRRLSSLGGPKCIGTIGSRYLGTHSCVLCREIILNSKRPLSEIPLCLVVLRFIVVHYEMSCIIHTNCNVHTYIHVLTEVMSLFLNN